MPEPVWFNVILLSLAWLAVAYYTWPRARVIRDGRDGERAADREESL